MATDFNAVTWTAQEMLTDVFRACRLPSTGTVDYTPAVVLSMATQSLHDWGGHLVSTAREGRMVSSMLRAMPGASLDTSGLTYELPGMAVADTIEAVLWVDPVTNVEKRLENVPVAMLPLFTTAFESGSPQGYAFVDGALRVFPRPTSGGNLRILYQRRHSALTITASDFSPITNVQTAGVAGSQTQIVCPPFSATLHTIGGWLDVVETVVPHRTRLHGLRVTATDGIAAITVDYPFASFQAVTTGGSNNIVCPFGKIPYLQLPLEMREPFTRQVSSRLLAEIGDMPLSMAHDQMAATGAQRARDMMQPRAKAQPEKLYNPNSIARGGAMRRRWGGE